MRSFLGFRFEFVTGKVFAIVLANQRAKQKKPEEMARKDKYGVWKWNIGLTEKDCHFQRTKNALYTI